MDRWQFSAAVPSPQPAPQWPDLAKSQLIDGNASAAFILHEPVWRHSFAHNSDLQPLWPVKG